MPLIQFAGKDAIANDLFDVGDADQAGNIDGNGVPHGCVGGAVDLAGGDHVPQGDVVAQQQRLLCLYVNGIRW